MDSGRGNDTSVKSSRDKYSKQAIWVLTANGLNIAVEICRMNPESDLFVISGLFFQIETSLKEKGISCLPFDSLPKEVGERFNLYKSHIFIMSTGIVVRMIAPHIKSKTVDPAIIVIDDRGRHCISLLSGHLGGANELAGNIADHIHADPVITTATDINNVPAIDVLAMEKDLYIENPEMIKIINRTLLADGKIRLHDPYRIMNGCIPMKYQMPYDGSDDGDNTCPLVTIDDRVNKSLNNALILRPASLVAGIGCNRNTSGEEITSFLLSVLKEEGLASGSLKKLASIDVKSDEQGLLDTVENLGLAIDFFSAEELNNIKKIENPSVMAEKHLGVKSVCEAAAIMASGHGKLVVPKKVAGNVTVAVARINYIL